MPKIIYAVSKGSYSDYSIQALYSTREKAQKFIDESVVKDAQWRNYGTPQDYVFEHLYISSDSYRIEKYILDPPDEIEPPGLGELTHGFSATIELESGDVTDVHDFSVRDFDYRQNPFWTDKRIDKEQKRFVTCLSKVSKDHAIKLAVEARQYWLRMLTQVEQIMPKEKHP